MKNISNQLLEISYTDEIKAMQLIILNWELSAIS